MGLNLGAGTRLMIGAMSVVIYATIAVIAWEGIRWVSALAAVLGAYRAWIWVRQVRWWLAAEEEEEDVEDDAVGPDPT